MRIRGLFIWQWLFLLFLFLLPWQTRLILRPGILNMGNWEYGIIGVYGTEILLWVVFLFWLVGENKNFNAFKVFKDIKDIKSRQFLLFLIFLFFSFFAIYFATDWLVALQSWRYIIEAIVVFFLIRRHSRPGWLVGAFLSGLAVQSVLGIWQFLAQSTVASRWLGLTNHFPWLGGSAVLENAAGRWLRAYGGLPHPNILGGYLVVGLFLIILIILKLSPDKRQDIEEITEIKKLRKLDIKKILLFTAYCLLSASLFFTFSRSAWIGLFIGLLIYWFISWRRKTIFQSFNLLILALFLLFTFYFLLFRPLVFSRLAATDRLEVQSTTERLTGYSEAWQLFQKHPLLGVGLGNYTLAVHRELDSSRPAWAYQPVHNALVLAFVELGISGILLTIILLSCFFISLFSYSSVQVFKCSSVHCSLRLGSGLALFIVLSLFDHYLWSLYSGWMLMAVGGGLGVAISREV